MRRYLERVIELQTKRSSKNTPEMEQRGRLVRDQIPSAIMMFQSSIRSALGEFGDECQAEGRDGTGAKTYVPWVRWHSTVLSPSAQNGWYIVYLFHPDASGVSLCLSHGSTSLEENTYVRRSDAEVNALMIWASQIIGEEFVNEPSVRRGVSLGSKNLPQAYERTTVFSKFYARQSVPDDATLQADLIRFCVPLRKLYKAQIAGLAPFEKHIDVAALEKEVEKITSPTRYQSGQGRGLSPPLRKLVELHAMSRAKTWLKSQGFTFTDVSSKESYDLLATKDNVEWVIEVKGTTGRPSSILVTENEVRLHLNRYPHNALIVIHGIELDEVRLHVGGGAIDVKIPWLIENVNLKPICYEYIFE